MICQNDNFFTTANANAKLIRAFSIIYVKKKKEKNEAILTHQKTTLFILTHPLRVHPTSHILFFYYLIEIFIIIIIYIFFLIIYLLIEERESNKIIPKFLVH